MVGGQRRPRFGGVNRERQIAWSGAEQGRESKVERGEEGGVGMTGWCWVGIGGGRRAGTQGVAGGWLGGDRFCSEPSYWPTRVSQEPMSASRVAGTCRSRS